MGSPATVLIDVPDRHDIVASRMVANRQFFTPFMRSTMSEHVNKVLPKNRRLTQSLAKTLISQAVTGTQHRLAYTDQDMADILGCSAGTVQNARNQSGQMQVHTLFELLSVNEMALDGFLNFYNRRSVPITAKCDTDAMLSTTGAVHSLALVQSPQSEGGAIITDNECLQIEDEVKSAIEALEQIQRRCHEIREKAA